MQGHSLGAPLRGGSSAGWPRLSSSPAPIVCAPMLSCKKGKKNRIYGARVRWPCCQSRPHEIDYIVFLPPALDTGKQYNRTPWLHADAPFRRPDAILSVLPMSTSPHRVTPRSLLSARAGLKCRDEAWAAEYLPEKVAPRRVSAFLACLGRNTRSLPACCPCRPRRPTEKQIVGLQATLARQLMPGPPVTMAHGRRPRSYLPHGHPDEGSHVANPPIKRQQPESPLPTEAKVDPVTGLLQVSRCPSSEHRYPFWPAPREIMNSRIHAPTDRTYR
eukprot:SAG31_NODE_2181_length_6246_cov_12.867252_2_plen_274_part_00